MKVQLDRCASPGPAFPASMLHEAAQSLRRSFSALRDDALAVLFPDICRICSAPLAGWSAAPVCTACTSDVTPQTGPLCTLCGAGLGMESARFAAALGITTCAVCRMVPPPFARAVAFGEYDAQLRELIHLLKYDRLRELADEPMAAWLAAAIMSLPLETTELAVVAVPLFAARETKRRFNQSVVLADAAIRRLRTLQPQRTFRAQHGALRRVRDTREQFALDPRQRRRNLRGAFQVATPHAVAGREVLLVDDIMTTGATARECARVLVAAGANKVWVATVARAQASVMRLEEIDEVVKPGLGEGIAFWDAPFTHPASDPTHNASMRS